jgi:hypothetical protein
MKKQILKIAGVKSEKEFYKKFPTEEAFMAKHGDAFKKAQIGAFIGGDRDAGFQPVPFKDITDQFDYSITGSTEDMRKEEAYRQAEIAAAQKATQGGSGGGGGLGSIANLLQSEELMSALGGAAGGARKGKKIKKAQGGEDIEMDTPGGMGRPLPPELIGQQTQFDIEEIQGGDFMNSLSKFAGPAGKLVQGIQQLEQEKRALESAEQMKDLSAIVKKAAGIVPEQTERRYLRPEDIKNTGEEFFPIYGVGKKGSPGGTNVLARRGASIGGGEIMNTFAPNTLYDDLGYEPLSDSERYKQFYHGGKMKKAQGGLEAFAQAGGSQMMGDFMTGITGENAGGNIGGTIGGTVGMIFGPAGQMVGQAAGQLIGTALDRKPQKIKKAKAAAQRNIQGAAFQQGIQGAQQQYSSFMKDGGTTSPYEWVSHTWQPQVIAKFGEHKLSDLLTPPKDADMLRAGGHLREYTPPSAAAMSTERPNFQMGGELQTHWGGYAEPMSYNPYLPEGGETVMFRGQSHDESDGKGNTGIGITYGDNPVEVERGEPAMKMKDGSTGDSSLVVFGNLKVPKGMLPGADGKNFKKYVAGLSEKEQKANKMINKASTAIDGMDVLTPYDQLAANTLQAQLDGGNQQLMEIAQNKMDASALQTAMNDTIEEFGLETTDRGTIKARKGMAIPKAQDGTKKLSKLEALADVPKGQKKGKIFYGGVTDADFETLKKENPWFDWNNFDPNKGTDIETFQKAFNKEAEALGVPTRLTVDKKLGKQTASARGLYDVKSLPPATVTGKKKGTPPAKETVEEEDITDYKRSTLMDIFNQILPFTRPSDAEELDPNQLAGEMFALATNDLDAVQARTFQPQLSVPYDISLQDMLNENEASYRSQQRLIGYNPAFQSMLNAQKYAANQKILGEQFRLNQGLKNQIYRENRSILDDAQLKNLGILDQQYARQAEAKSKTKATTQAALNSIASKYAQNKLENRTLQVYENMYNYRFDPKFRALNMNPLWQPNMQTVPVLDEKGNVAYYQQKPGAVNKTAGASESKVKQGGKVNKKALNGSIVKALKNI